MHAKIIEAENENISKFGFPESLEVISLVSMNKIKKGRQTILYLVAILTQDA
jgi:hypothetical protein